MPTRRTLFVAALVVVLLVPIVVVALLLRKGIDITPSSLVVAEVVTVSSSSSSSSMSLRPLKPVVLSTTFGYETSELDEISDIEDVPDLRLRDLFDGDRQAMAMVAKYSVPPAQAAKIYASLAVAQRDMAHLLEQAVAREAGDVRAVTQKVLCLYFPGDCPQVPGEPVDAVSDRVATIVVSKLQVRHDQEMAEARPYVRPNQEGVWPGADPELPEAGTWRPWVLSRGSELRVAPPPAYGTEAEWADVLALREELMALTPEKVQVVEKWAAGRETSTIAGTWLELLDGKLQDSDATLGEVLDLRAAVTMAMADASIATADSAYTYWVMRPNMRVEGQMTVVPTPWSPSYPSNHAVVSLAAATVISHAYPAEQSHWLDVASEIGQSQIWAGVHYPLDVEAGIGLGRAVGNRVVRATAQW